MGNHLSKQPKERAFEETGLEIDDLKLFGIYSGESCFVQYPNGDKAYSVQVIFTTTTYSGVLKQQGIESREHRFFRREALPENLNPRQKQFIIHWAERRTLPVIS